MTQLPSLRRDESAVAAVEMALTLPVLITFIYGIFMIGIAFQANAGMQNALGEGARYATIYPTPSDSLIKQRITDKVFGLGIGDFSPPTVTSSPGYKTLAVSFQMTPNFLFFQSSPITMRQSKRVYTAV